MKAARRTLRAVFRSAAAAVRPKAKSAPVPESHSLPSPSRTASAPLGEALLVPFFVLLAVLSALLPALAAYRTDVAKWL